MRVCVMASRLRKHATLLRLLAKASPSVARSIIKVADADLIDLLSECAHNILKGNIRLTPKRKQQLRRHANSLRKIATKKTSINARKRTIAQKGGFVGALMGAMVPLLGSVVPPMLRAVVPPLVSAISGLGKKRRRH